MSKKQKKLEEAQVGMSSVGSVGLFLHKDALEQLRVLLGYNCRLHFSLDATIVEGSSCKFRFRCSVIASSVVIQ
jgi:hypothetical protein